MNIAGFWTPTVLFSFLWLKLRDLGFFQQWLSLQLLHSVKKTLWYLWWTHEGRIGLIRHKIWSQCFTTVDPLFKRECGDEISFNEQVFLLLLFLFSPSFSYIYLFLYLIYSYIFKTICLLHVLLDVLHFVWGNLWRLEKLTQLLGNSRVLLFVHQTKSNILIIKIIQNLCGKLDRGTEREREVGEHGQGEEWAR